MNHKPPRIIPRGVHASVYMAEIDRKEKESKKEMTKQTVLTIADNLANTLRHYNHVIDSPTVGYNIEKAKVIRQAKYEASVEFQRIYCNEVGGEPEMVDLSGMIIICQGVMN